MTNGEKFKEVFGFEVNKPTVNYGMYCPHGRKDMNDRAVECVACNRDCISDFWQSEYKEPNDTFTFGQNNKVALLINLDENIYKIIKRGFLDTLEIRDVREAIINGRKVVGEVADEKGSEE